MARGGRNSHRGRQRRTRAADRPDRVLDGEPAAAPGTRGAGDEGVQEVLRRTGVPYTAAFLDDVANWIWYEEAIAIFEAGAELTGEPRIGLRAGEQAVRQHAGTQVATLLRSLGSPEAILEQCALVATKFSTVTTMRTVELAPGRAYVLAEVRPGITSHRLMCDFRIGLLATPTELFGLPPGRVEEKRC